MPKTKIAKKSTATKHQIVAEGGGGAAMKVLNTLAVMKVKMGRDEIEKKKLGGYAEITGASTLRNAVAKLTKAASIVVTKETVAITDKGLALVDLLAAIEQCNIPTTNQAHQDKIKSGLTDKQAGLFEAIADGRVHDKKEVIKIMKMTMNSTWRNMLAPLAKKNIIEHGKSSIQLHKDLFPIEPRPE